MKNLIDKNIVVEQYIVALQASLPPIFARKEVSKLLGGAISSGTLANLQCKGHGPTLIRTGRNAIYEKNTFIAWFKQYLEGGIKATMPKEH